jgi:hypothetical protein
MITPIVKDSKVVFGPVRLSYTHLFNKYNPNGDQSDGKYQTNALIPKNEKETVKAIQQAIEAAKKAGIVSKWSGKEPKKLEQPLHDGDTDKEDDDIYLGHYFVNAKSKTRPGIVDRQKAPITDEDEIYSGVYAILSVTFYAYDQNGNRGIACGLNNVMKFKDGEHLGGRASAESDFADLDTEDDDDL